MQLLDSQKGRNYDTIKWFEAFNEDENTNKNLLKKFSENKILLNNNNENEKNKILSESYFETPSINAHEKMNNNTDTLLLMLNHFGDKCVNTSFEKNLNEFREIQEKIDNGTKVRKNEIKYNSSKKIIRKNKYKDDDSKLSTKNEKMKFLPLSDTKYESHSKNEKYNDSNYSSNNNINQKLNFRNDNKKLQKSGKSCEDDNTESVNNLYDEKYEKFRYSVNVLRESIVQGTAARNFNDNENNDSNNNNANNDNYNNNNDNNNENNDDINNDNTINDNNYYSNHFSISSDNHDYKQKINNNDSNLENQNFKGEKKNSKKTNEKQEEIRRKNNNFDNEIRNFRNNSLSHYNSSVQESLIDDYDDYLIMNKNDKNRIESINNSTINCDNNSGITNYNKSNKNNYSEFISLNSNLKKIYYDTENKNDSRRNEGNNKDGDSIIYDYYHNIVNADRTPQHREQLYKSDLGSNSSQSNTRSGKTELGSNTSHSKLRSVRTESDWIQWAKAGEREPLFSKNSKAKNVLWSGEDESDPGSRLQQNNWEFNSDSGFRSGS